MRPTGFYQAGFHASSRNPFHHRAKKAQQAETPAEPQLICIGKDYLLK